MRRRLRSSQVRVRSGWRVMVGCFAVGALSVAGARWLIAGREPVESFALASVRRADLELALIVGGNVEGSERTEIRCEIEAIHPDGTPAQGPTIIELIDDGTWVKKDDVLLRFDASGYEEMARRQRIEVDRAASEAHQAELEREAAEVALVAYRDGQALEYAQSLRGRIALLASDLERAREQQGWSRRMRELGYVSADELASAEIAVQRLAIDLQAAETAYRNQRQFVEPKWIRELEIRVERAEDEVEFCRVQLENVRKQLENYEKQIQKCTVRAPHDGFAIHAAAHFWGDEFQMRVGASIYQGQPLFYLPDLSRPVVEVSLNETIAARVAVGMEAEVRIESFPDRVFRGRVKSIDQLPTINWRAGWDVMHRTAQVEVIDPPRDGLLPSMSAQVRIITERRIGALVVPVTALAVDPDGEPYCYVSGSTGALERRPVEVRPADRERLQILSGLDEGERVVIDPTGLADTRAIPTRFAPSLDEDTRPHLSAAPVVAESGDDPPPA